MASKEIQRWEQKKELYALFGGKIETDIIDMVFDGCNDQVEDAKKALSNMCLMSEDTSNMKTAESGTRNVPGDTVMEETPMTKQRTLYLLRGLPGSGKSYLANRLKQRGDVILSTDDFFKSKGRFEFRGDQLQDAHEWNLASARAAMRSDDINNIFIDNTNTRCWEMKPYVVAALNHGYNVEFLIPQTPWAWDINELERRNSHGVPRGTLLKMLDRFERGVTIDRILSTGDQSPLQQPFERAISLHEKSRRALNANATHLAGPSTGAPMSESALLDQFPSVTKKQLNSTVVTQETANASLESNVASLPQRYEDFVFPGRDLVVDQDFDAELEQAYLSLASKNENRERLRDKDPRMSTFERESCTSNEQSNLETRSSKAERPKPENRDPPFRNSSSEEGLAACAINKTDLEFLLECFPDYDRDVLESILMRFGGDIQRTCNEIMEQPLVKMNAFDRLQSINDNLDAETKMDELEGEGSAVEDKTVEAICVNVKPDIRPDLKRRKFVVHLDRTFIIDMKRSRGEEDLHEDDELEFPIDKKFANEIYQQWERYCKVKRKRLEKDNTREGGGNFRIEEDNVRHRPKRPCSAEKASTTSESSKPEERERLKGSFSPWAQSKPQGATIDHRIDRLPNGPIWDANQERSENRLYTLFASVSKDVLDNIYEAMGYDVDAAIQAVKASLNYQQQESFGARKEPALPLDEATKEPASTQAIIENDMFVKRRPESEGVLDEGNRGASPGRADDGHWNTVQGRRTKYIDLTDDIDEASFQSLSGTSYADFRAEAQAHAAIRKEWLRKAALAYQNKQGHVWSYCAGEARKQAILMKEANARAAALIFEIKNSARPDSTSIDLHGLHCDEAVEVLDETLSQAKTRDMRYIDVITGRGLHSKSKVPKLKNSVVNYLKANEYRFRYLNQGCLRVTLR